MRWRKRDIWKAGITIAGMLLLLVLMIWVPVSVAGAYEGVSGLATPGTATVQATPTEDATVTALNKEKLAQEIQQLKNQNDRSIAAWFWNSGGLLGTVVAALLAVAGVLATVVFNFRQWTGTQKTERENERTGRQEAQDKDLKDKAEERFKTAVTALGDEKEGVQLGGAILLRSFLNKDDEKIYGRYYTQIFDLAVAYLRLPRTSNPPEDPDGIPHSPEDPNAPLPLTTLRQALIVVFKEAFPLVREQLKKPGSQFSPHHLDATAIQLDKAYLRGCDLKLAWMPQASLREIDLCEADLREANLNQANLSGANLRGANLRGANLREAHLHRANLRGAVLDQADLRGADLKEADLSQAQCTGANLTGANLTNAKLAGLIAVEAILVEAFLEEADLTGANLMKANLTEARLMKATFTEARLVDARLTGAFLMEAHLTGTDFTRADLANANLSQSNPEDAASLKGTKMHFVRGLTPDQRKACAHQGAEWNILEAFVAGPDRSSPRAERPLSQEGHSSPPPPTQSNNAQAPSARPAQESAQTPGTDGSSTTSSQQGPGS